VLDYQTGCLAPTWRIPFRMGGNVRAPCRSLCPSSVDEVVGQATELIASDQQHPNCVAGFTASRCQSGSHVQQTLARKLIQQTLPGSSASSDWMMPLNPDPRLTACGRAVSSKIGVPQLSPANAHLSPRLVQLCVVRLGRPSGWLGM
jgi:hypothetical protein